MKTTLTLDEVDQLVRESLIESYELARLETKIDCSNDIIEPDEKLLAALEEVIEYYSTEKQFSEWKAQYLGEHND